MALDLNICSSVCTDCIKCYKKKHNIVSGSGGKFKIYCEGIPSQYIKPDLLQVLPPEQAEAALSLMDPVAWAAQTLDWHCTDEDGSIWKRKNPEEYQRWIDKHPGESVKGHSRYHRPYQQTMLRCLHEETDIFMADGSVKMIKDVNIGDKVITYNEGRKKTQHSYKVLNKWENGEKDVYQIELQNGDILKVTDNHPILSWFHEGRINKLVQEKSFKRVYKSLQDGLSVGDKVYTLNQFGIFGDITDLDLAKLLGYIVTDGYVCNSGRIGDKHVLEFRNIRYEYIQEYRSLLKKIFGIEVDPLFHPERIDKDGTIHKRHWSLAVFNRDSSVLTFLRSIGCFNKETRELSILDFAFKFSREALGIFINRCWAGDGCIYNKDEHHLEFLRTTLSLASGNREFLERYRLLLKKIGIQCSHIYKEKLDSEAKGISLRINRIADVERFFSFVGPIYGKIDQSLLAINETSQRTHWRKHGGLTTLSRTKIVDIKYLGKLKVFDLEVETRHNFIANGIIVHNCSSKRKVFRLGRQLGKTETLSVSILYNMFVKPGKAKDESFTVIVITPYQSQIELIFKRLNELISSSSTIANSIKRSVKAPNYSLELYNGSSILGFTAGTKSAGNADAVRGQHGDMLVFDESDLLNPSDIDSALAIVTNHPDATVWMSSTPTGKRERFYTTCHSKLYKEFYYPSQVNPLWSEELDALYKEQLTELGYKHEILAEFGEQEEGVFQNAYIDAAKLDYTYGQLVRKPDWIYGLGVDWNDTKIGTDISIIGFNPTTGTFFLMQREVVSKEGWTQLSACEKISTLNAFWRPAFIYIDKGYGNTQDEVLRKRGYDALFDPNRGPSHPDAKLKDIVKTYDFGGSIEIRDLITQQPIKKAAKPFLVENTVRRFETRTIHFSDKDELLEKQLLNYIISRKTSAGVPVYNPSHELIGDHALDSLMLALVGSTLEKTPFGKPIVNSDFAFVPRGAMNLSSVDDGSLGGTRIVDPRNYNQDRQLQQKPSLNRSSKLVGKESIISQVEKIPAANLNQGAGVSKLWSWPGFGNDASRPKMKPLDEVLSEARGSNRTSLSRPKRKMF
jgi:replicative DNA helicase